jgi:hypothetical protein
MKSHPNSDAVNKSSTASRPPAGGTGYAPSVPISVYRELSAELQATKTLLDSLNLQNQQLARHNHHLRQEIEQLAQSAVNLQQTAESFQPSWGRPHPEVEPRRTSRPPRSPMAESISEELVIEQVEPRPRVRSQAPQREVGGLWLILIITAIVLTAFGAGFLVVRPLLSPNR